MLSDAERRNVLACMYDGIDSVKQITKDSFIESALNLDITPIYDGNEIIGGYFANGVDMHISVTKKGKALTALRNGIKDALEKNGVITTSVRHENSRTISLLKRLGFYETGTTETHLLMRITK